MSKKITLIPREIEAFLACAEIGADGYPEGWPMETEVDWILKNILSKKVISIEMVFEE